MDKTPVSKGSLGIIGNYEYFTFENSEVYRAPAGNYIGQNGYRMGGRWQAPAHMVDECVQAAKENQEKFG